MQIRLLNPFQLYKANQIVSLASDWERYLILTGQATYDLTGGIPYVAPAAARRLVPASLVLDGAGAVLGIEGPGGSLIPVSGSATAPGAPTGLTLTAGAGAVTAAFSAPSNNGGSAVTGYVVTLSNGITGSGTTSPITITTPGGVAVTATVKAYSAAAPSGGAASAVSNSVTPTGSVTNPVANALILTGPTAAVAGTPSGAYTVALAPTGGTLASPVTVTPTAVAGVTFSPASVTLSTASPSASFTANASTTGIKAISVLNNGGLASPAAINLVVSAAGGIIALNSASIFGGSHSAYGQPYVTGAAPNGGGGTSLSDLGFMNDQLRKTGPGLDLINLRAEGGTTVFQQRLSQLPQVLTDSSDGAIYYSSANAYNDTMSAPLNGNAPYTQAQIIAAEIDIMQQVAASKKWVIWFNLTPVSQSGTTGAAPRASQFPAHNAAMKTEAEKHPNVLFIDAYTFFLDPTSQQLNPKVDYIQAVDGIHKTTLGARLFAEYYTPIVAAFIASFTKYRTKGANMLKPWSGTGGTALPGTGTITGIENLPAGYQLEVASGTTNVIITKPDANTVRVAMTNPATSTASTVQIVATNGAEMVAAMVSGDAIQGGFDFAQVGTATGLTRVATSIRINGSTSGTSWRSMFRDTNFEPDASFKMDQRALSARRLWNPWRLPSTPTAVDYFIQWNLLAQGTATFDITSTEVCKLT